MSRHFYEAVATLVGATIGAGILGIPYVVASAGFWTGMLVIFLVFIAILFTNLYLGEVILRTKGKHQLTGYAEKYLGKTGRNLMAAAVIFGIYGSLIAYVLGEGSAFAAIFGGDQAIYSLLFFAFGSIVLLLGLKIFEKFELWISGLVILTITAICLTGAGSIDPGNLAEFRAERIFIPFGVILFAFIGAPAIPEVAEELGKHRKEMKRALFIGTLIPLIMYILFATVTVGVVGKNFTFMEEKDRVATAALGLFLGDGAMVFANLFAIFTMATAFLALGMALKETFQYDYKTGKGKALAMTLTIPLLVFLYDSFVRDVANFISLLGIAGAITGGVMGILIILMHRKAKKKGDRKPEFQVKDNVFVGIALIILFLLGIAYQIIATIL